MHIHRRLSRPITVIICACFLTAVAALALPYLRVAAVAMSDRLHPHPLWGDWHGYETIQYQGLRTHHLRLDPDGKGIMDGATLRWRLKGNDIEMWISPPAPSYWEEAARGYWRVSDDGRTLELTGYNLPNCVFYAGKP